MDGTVGAGGVTAGRWRHPVLRGPEGAGDPEPVGKSVWPLSPMLLSPMKTPSPWGHDVAATPGGHRVAALQWVLSGQVTDGSASWTGGQGVSRTGCGSRPPGHRG